MRACAKMRCGADPVATIWLRYQEREVVVAELTAERDSNGIDLCREHSDRITPPIGWTVVTTGSEARARVGSSVA